MQRAIQLSLLGIVLMTGCQAQSYPLPESQKLSVEKVARIAATIEQAYPRLSVEVRSKLLITVVQSLDNMVFVEGGEFQMGDFGWPFDDDPTNLCDWPCGVEPEQMGNISPLGDDDFVHNVKLSSYHLSKFQVTLENFDLFFTAQGKPVFDAEDRTREDLQNLYRPNNPTATKDWQEAKDYCEWLGHLSGYPVDLPTEAQWEFAARNRGQHVAFPTDNGSLNYDRNFPNPDELATFPVDRFVPNPLGIYNLSGNTTDWVNDWYDKDYYRQSPLENPQGPESGTQKVRRGANIGEDPLLTGNTVTRFPADPIRSWYFPTTSFRCAIQTESQL